MKISAKNIRLTPVDELFSSEESRSDASRERVVELPLAEMHPFKNHPFKVLDDEKMVEALSERAGEVHADNVNPSEDNMLKITSDGRKLRLDQRLINPMLPDDPGSKVNACVGNVFRIWSEGQDKRLTQLVFCDMSTPKASAGAENPEFSVYDDIRAKLIRMGVPVEEIAFIHDANTEARKKELFGKVRSGQVRVLMGSTAKMGAGTNVRVTRS